MPYFKILESSLQLHQFSRTTLRWILAGLLLPCLLFQAALVSRIFQDIWQPQNAVTKGFTLSAPWPTVEAVSLANQDVGLATGDILLEVDGKPFEGLRSAYAALATVLDTAKHQGVNLFQKLVSLMGQPILHYLQPLSP